ncbi:MAG: hypothetical protein J6Y17_02885 [Elusimicrobiaceae bacterium]|nr:hypothetical protein [Elusimicrobiaceae bacterium]
MRRHIVSLVLVSLCSLSFAQALPQTNVENTLQDKLDTALEQTAQVSPVFGSVEALWQYTSNPPHNRSSVQHKTLQIRTHATAVISGELVFIHLTPGFAPGGLFVKQPTLLELTFTALDGTKVSLQPSYQPLKRHWVFSHVKNTAD